MANKVMCAVLTNFMSIVYEDLGVAWKRPMAVDIGPGQRKGEFVASFTPVLRFAKSDTCAPFNQNTIIATYEVDGMIEAMYLEKSNEIFSKIMQPKTGGIVAPSAADIANIGKV